MCTRIKGLKPLGAVGVFMKPGESSGEGLFAVAAQVSAGSPRVADVAIRTERVLDGWVASA